MFYSSSVNALQRSDNSEMAEKIKPKHILIPAGIAGAGLAAWLLLRGKPPIPPENIVLSDLVVEPTEVYVGEPVSISMVATNIGEVAGSYQITCEVI